MVKVCFILCDFYHNKKKHLKKEKDKNSTDTIIKIDKYIEAPASVYIYSDSAGCLQNHSGASLL